MTPRYVITMATVQWNSAQAHAWNRLYEKAPGPTAYQQHWAYGEAAKELGGEVARAIIYDGDTPVALYQALQRKIWKASLWLGMRGPVWLKDNLPIEQKASIYRQLRNGYPARWPSFHLLMPEEEEEEDGTLVQAGLRRIITGYATVIIDLSQEKDALMVALDGKWRNRLRTVQKSDIVIHKVGYKPAAYHWILMAEAAQRARIRYAALTPELVPIYQSHAGKDSVIALRAEWKGQDIAAMLCLIHGHSATYHIGWSNAKGKEYNAHNLLLWEMICLLKKHGIRWFDLGGVNTEHDSAGIARFKIGTGGKVIQLTGSYA